MSSDRQRNRKNRISKRAILVSYEGKNKTEDIYLGNYNGRDNNYVIRKVPGNDTDPISLVEHTIAKVRSRFIKSRIKAWSSTPVRFRN